MALETMYKGIPFSPVATLTANISATDTVIPVSDVNAFPDAPNIATIGTDTEAETIIYCSKTTDSLSGCTRGVEGTAKEWYIGEIISRNFTAKDHEDIIKNINYLNGNKLNTTDVVDTNTEELKGKALDATQNNPNISGTLAKKIRDNTEQINVLNKAAIQGVITGAQSGISIARSLLIKKNGWVELDATFCKSDLSNFIAGTILYVAQAAFDSTIYNPLTPSICLAAHCTNDVNGLPTGGCVAMLWRNNQGIIVTPSIACTHIRVSGKWYVGGGTI